MPIFEQRLDDLASLMLERCVINLDLFVIGNFVSARVGAFL